MGDFKRISDPERNPIDVLNEPMELGLVPRTDYFVFARSIPWDGQLAMQDFHKGSWREAGEEPSNRDGKRGRELHIVKKGGFEEPDEFDPSAAIKSELYDRYRWALRLLWGPGAEPVSLSDESLHALSTRCFHVQRLMTLAFPGLQLFLAAQAFEEKHGYANLKPSKKIKFEILLRARDHGYRLPCEVSRLIERGAGSAIPTSIISEVSRQIWSGEDTKSAACRDDIRNYRNGFDLWTDRVSKRSKSRWPMTVFDFNDEPSMYSEGGFPTKIDWSRKQDAYRQGSTRLLPRFRYLVFDRIARDAFRKAYFDNLYEGHFAIRHCRLLDENAAIQPVQLAANFEELNPRQEKFASAAHFAWNSSNA